MDKYTQSKLCTQTKDSVGSCISEPYAIPSGVPQGGLLSPLLFVICINKLLMGSLPGLTQKALDSVADWGQEFSLTMNGAKTKDMVISARRQTISLLHLLRSFLAKTLVESPLSNCLEFRSHCSSALSPIACTMQR
uniref:Reverse transcriptase domain-containing protein n=1 Tax=Astyanax mexicanus TaxID=7994 RepID=A0A3B1K460_ASTMX